MDSDGDVIWSRLTEQERKEFHSMLKDGRLANMLELWQPWWTNHSEALVQDVTDNKGSLGAQSSQGAESSVGAPKDPNSHPKILSNIPDLNRLLPKSRPADNVVFSVINILYGYCYVTRLHNGDHLETPGQCVEELLDISGGLNNKQFGSVPEAVQSCQQAVLDKGRNLFISPGFSAAIIVDVKLIIQGPGKMSAQSSQSAPRLPSAEGSKRKCSVTFTLAAMSEMSTMLDSAKKELSKDIKSHAKESDAGKQLRAQRQTLFLANKKLEFLMSWSNRYATILDACVVELDMEFCSQSSNLIRHVKDKVKFEESWGGKIPSPRISGKLIEDITPEL